MLASNHGIDNPPNQTNKPIEQANKKNKQTENKYGLQIDFSNQRTIKPTEEQVRTDKPLYRRWSAIQHTTVPLTIYRTTSLLNKKQVLFANRLQIDPLSTISIIHCLNQSKNRNKPNNLYQFTTKSINPLYQQSTVPLIFQLNKKQIPFANRNRTTVPTNHRTIKQPDWTSLVPTYQCTIKSISPYYIDWTNNLPTNPATIQSTSINQMIFQTTYQQAFEPSNQRTTKLIK